MRRLGMWAALIAAGVSVIWTLYTLRLTYLDGMLFPNQMLRTFPTHKVGLCAAYHWGLMNDLFLWSAAVALIVGWHGTEWRIGQMAVMLVIGMILSGLMHWVYVQTPFPDPLAWKEVGITRAGWSHVLYMGVGFAIVGLFYLCSATTPRELVVISLLLAAHVAIGNHILVGWLNEKYWHLDFMPDFLHKPHPWVTIAATCVILAGLSWWSSGSWHTAGMFLFICGLIVSAPTAFKGLASLGRFY